ADVAIILAFTLVAIVAGVIARETSWRPGQWAALGTGALMMAAVITYLSFPDVRSLIDPAVPPWSRAAWLGLGTASILLGPSLVDELTKPREPGTRGLWHPSRWSFDGVSTVMQTLLVALLAFLLYDIGATKDLFWYFAAGIAIMVAPL